MSSSIRTKLYYATGLNLLTNSIGFLIKNELNLVDTNTYIVFSAHSLPKHTVVVPFLFENVVYTGPNPGIVTTTLYFKVIGLDNALDVAVGVLDAQNQYNDNYSLSSTVPIRILDDTTSFTCSDTFYFAANNNALHSKAIKSTTIENFEFNGPADMVQFLYPKSVLVQQQALVGTSGSPLVVEQEGDLVTIGMMVQRLSNGDKYEPVAVHCSLMVAVVYREILPRYLAEVHKAVDHPEEPNILNDQDYVAEYISQGIPKCFLGFFGQYINQELVQSLKPLQQARNLKGFVVLSFYKSYDLSTNQFSPSTLVKRDLNNNVVRIYTPFNPPDSVPSRLYTQNSTAKVSYCIVQRITFTNKYTSSLQTIQDNDSLSTFMYYADPTLPFDILYLIFEQDGSGDTAWVPYTDTIQPQTVQYNVNGSLIVTTTTQFPPFALGNEVVGNVWNMTREMTPYTSTLLAAYDPRVFQNMGASDWAGLSYSNNYAGQSAAWQEAQRNYEKSKEPKASGVDTWVKSEPVVMIQVAAQKPCTIQ